MNMKSFRLAGRALTALLAALLLMLAPACSSDDNNDGNPEGGNGGNGGNPSATLTVSPEKLTLGAATGASASVTVTTDAAWTAAPTGEGFTFSPSEGSGNATIIVKAAAANEESSEKQLGQITVTAEEVGEPVTVTVSQEGNTPEPLPETVVITLDFALGPDITDPALPSKSADALYGRHEYTIDGRMYAIYAEGGNTNNGKFFWNDQNSYEGANIQEPNKALFFSKEGAYIEFPAVDGKTLSKVEYINSTGAGKTLPTFDITTDQGVSLNPVTDITADQSLITFTASEVALNTRCRLVIVDNKNAQPAKLVLTYTIPEV